MTGRDVDRTTGVVRPMPYALGIGVFVSISLLTQLEVVQGASGHLLTGLPWDIGRWEIIADILAPAWAVSLIVLAALLRRLVQIWPGPSGDPPTGWFAERFLTKSWAVRATWMATVGAVLLIVLAWTREWERFGQRPSIFWYVLLLATTIGFLAVPTWWIRFDLFAVTSRFLLDSRWFASLNRYFFDESKDHPRWANALALAAVTLVGGLTVLTQLDRLLQGMRPEGSGSAGVAALAGLSEVDLSRKPDLIATRVAAWREYSESVGDGFASAYRVVVSHVAVDTLLVVPAIAAIGVILIIVAWRWRPTGAAPTVTTSYSIILQTCLFILIVVVVADVIENVLTWYVMDRAWRPDAMLAPANARLLWAASAVRTVGLVLLGAFAVLLLALRGVHFRRIFVAVGAVRAELILLGVVAIVLLTQAQAADVIRQWDVGVALTTAFLATVLAMLLHQTSSTTLSRLEHDAESVREGDTPTPAEFDLPGIGIIGLRTTIVGLVFALAATQVVLRLGARWPVGLGFLIPAALIAVLWVFGVALPPKVFVRGDRAVSPHAKRLIPRFLGSALFLALGIAILKAAIPDLVFARHEDWYLLLCIVPPAVGAWRLHSGSYDTMGSLELAIATAVGMVAVLRIAVGDRELSPGALTFVGVMVLYGALPFFYSYGHSSIPSRFTLARLAWVPVRPLILIGAVFGGILAALLVARPVRVAPEIGTIAIVLTGAMFLTLVGAGMVRFSERTEAPRVLAAFGVNRTPMFVILGLWLLVGGALVTTGNNVRLLEVSGADADGLAAGIPVNRMWDRWLERNQAQLRTTAASDRAVVPMVFISSSGGGVRASVWTSYVLDCLFEREASENGSCGTYREAAAGRSDVIAVMSGVSGGGLGLAGYSSFLAGGNEEGSGDWVKEKMGVDSLSPTMAWLLYVDLPRALIGFGSGIPDRAAVTEWAWEAPWGADGALGRGVFDLWHHEPDLPPVVFNGTNAGDDCRFNASVFRTNAQAPGSSCMDLSVYETNGSIADDAVLAATDDLIDYLCADQDVRLSSAVHLAARFPIVATSGRVGAGLVACGDAGRVAYVVDGGYLEGSASGTLLEIWNALEDSVAEYNATSVDGPCIVPFAVHIDNGYEEPTAAATDPDPGELLLPLRTLAGGQFGRYANARQAEALEFSRPLTAGGRPISVVKPDGTTLRDRYARITTRAHPGVEAPLGWSLSDASIDDLREQLDLPANRLEIDEVRDWIDAPLTCRVGS
jgi:hypothetical protein